MNLRKLILAGTAVGALLCAPAQASIIDNPQFRVLGLVIVWGANAADSGAPIVSDFIIGDGSSTDLIADDVHAVVTGTLLSTPATVATGGEFEISGAVGAPGVIDASSAFGAFELDANTDVTLSDDLTENSSFYVASNTAFSINAVASATTATGFDLSDIGFALSVTPSGDDGLAFGQDAQFPHTDDSATAGVVTTVDSLDDMEAGPTLVFAGNRLTAATAGSIADQSVRFDAEYTLIGSSGTGYDLSDGTGVIETEVVYTVFVP